MNNIKLLLTLVFLSAHGFTFAMENTPSTASTSNQHTCHRCKNKFNEDKKCSRCKQVSYCSIDCQKLDWTNHKLICQQDGKLIAEAQMDEMVITHSGDAKPIVGTDGLGPCIALGGYDPNNKVAFIVHFSRPENLSSKDLILNQIKSLLVNPVKEAVKIYIVGGFRSGPLGPFGLPNSQIRLRLELKKWIAEWNLPIEIVSDTATPTFEEMLRKGYRGKTLSIDSRNGGIGTYNPNLNPYALPTKALDEQHEIKIVYRPNPEAASK